MNSYNWKKSIADISAKPRVHEGDPKQPRTVPKKTFGTPHGETIADIGPYERGSFDFAYDNIGGGTRTPSEVEEPEVLRDGSWDFDINGKRVWVPGETDSQEDAENTIPTGGIMGGGTNEDNNVEDSNDGGGTNEDDYNRDPEIDGPSGDFDDSETVDGTTEEDIVNVGDNENKTILESNAFLFEQQAEQRASEIYDPLIEGQEQAKEAIDFQTQLQIDGINKAIPYITRQFEAYQAKNGVGSGMQARQQNELVMDIADKVGTVYDSATMKKYAIDSKISEYQSAMAAGKQQLATQLYNQALSQAQFNADYLGMDYIQPEIQFVYDQMTAAKSQIADPNASAEERQQAQTTYDQLTSHLQDLGYSGDIGEGLTTYQQQQQAMQQANLEMQELIANELYDVEMASILDTTQATIMLNAGATIEEVLEQFPLADVNALYEWVRERESGSFSLDDLPTGGSDQY